MQSIDPGVAAYLPRTQSVQVAMLVAPTVAEYFPGMQSVQVTAAASECFPASQSVHTGDPGDTAYLPRSQSTHDELPLGLAVPDGQSSHASSEVAVEMLLYFPSKHDVQTEAPLGENFPVSQSKQVAMLVAAAVTEYFPATHGVHVVAAVVAEYFPATH